MRKTQLFLFAALLAAESFTVHAKRSWPLVDFDNLFDRMDEQMQEMRKQMLSVATIPSQLTIAVDEHETDVQVTLKGIETQELDARINNENNLLTINTPTDKIFLELQGRYLFVQARHENRKSVEKQETDSSDKKEESTVVGTIVSQFGQSLENDIQLGEQTIDYDPAEKSLVITFPIKIASKGIPVPITIKAAKTVPMITDGKETVETEQ